MIIGGDFKLSITRTKKDIVKKLLNRDLNEEEEKDIIELIVDNPLAIDIDKREEESMEFKDRLADKMSSLFGSWTFIIIFSLFLLFWILFNTIISLKGKTSFDPYPFILLNLFLSCVAALQAPIIMMSQNRQSKKDSLRSKYDYKIDLKSELIIEILYEHIEKLEKNQKEILTYLKNPDHEIKLYTEDEVNDLIEKAVLKKLKELKMDGDDSGGKNN